MKASARRHWSKPCENKRNRPTSADNGRILAKTSEANRNWGDTPGDTQECRPECHKRHWTKPGRHRATTPGDRHRAIGRHWANRGELGLKTGLKTDRNWAISDDIGRHRQDIPMYRDELLRALQGGEHSLDRPDSRLHRFLDHQRLARSAGENPVAVGETLRRLTAKASLATVTT